MRSVMKYVGQAAMDERRRSAVRELLPILEQMDLAEEEAAR